MNNDKKAQSALEYMMTYGWAILIIVIVAGVLYGLGIFNPAANSGQQTVINGFMDVPVTGALVNSSYFRIVVSNQAGQIIKINNATLQNSGTTDIQNNCTNAVLKPSQTTSCYIKGSFAGSTIVVTGNIFYSFPGSAIGGGGTSTGTIRLPSSNTSVFPPAIDVFVANAGGTTVSVISSSGLLSNSVVGTIKVGLAPVCPAVTPNGNLVYVTNYGSNTTSVSYVSNFTTFKNISMGKGATPYGIAITPNGKLAYVADYGNARVGVINLTTNTVIKNISTPAGDRGITVSSDGKYVVVVEQPSAEISVINTTSQTTIRNVTLPATFPQENPEDAAISSNDTFIYVSAYTFGLINVISTINYHVVANLSTYAPLGIALSSNGNQLYVIQRGNNQTNVFSTASRSSTATITGLGYPEAITLNANAAVAYATNEPFNTTAVINLLTNRVINTLSGFQNPWGLSDSNICDA